MTKEMFDLLEKTSYKKNGVLITPAPFNKCLAFAYKFTVDNEIFTGILYAGKMRRAERSFLVSGLLKVIEENRLVDMEIGRHNTKTTIKGFYILSKPVEVQNA